MGTDGRLRVAILSRKWSLRGGNERMAAELARQLGRMGHPVRVICHKVDDSAAEVTPAPRIDRILGVSFDPTLAMITYARGARARVRALRAAGEVDVVVGFGASVRQDVYRLGGGTHAEFLALSRDRRVARGGPILDRIALRLERARLAEHASPFLIAPSHRVREELLRHYEIDPARITVIWNGIDLDRFAPGAPPGERAAVRARWGASAEEKLALFVGQDPGRKGLDTAIEVARQAGLRLVYVGPAKKRSDSPPHVIWDGEQSDVETAYRSADVMLAPSRYDPFGGAVLEAYACGLPAVATDRIGATERARGTPLASLLVSDPEDVATQVANVARALDPSLREAARAVASGATRDRWGEEMAAVIERAHAKRRGA